MNDPWWGRGPLSEWEALGMARPRAVDPFRVVVSVKLRYGQGRLLDALRGNLSRGAYLRLLLVEEGRRRGVEPGVSAAETSQ